MLIEQNYIAKKPSKNGYSDLEWLAQQGVKFVHVEPNSKKPVGTGWQNKPISLALAKKYAEMGDNIGMLCGQYSNNIGLIDLDKGYRMFCKMFPDLANCPTIIRDDPDRAKIPIRISGEMLGSQKFSKNGSQKIEWLSDGNHGVVWGAVNGIRYRLINIRNGAQIPILTPDEFSELWSKWIGEKSGGHSKGKPIPKIIYEGNRNMELTRTAGVMRSKGMSFDAIYAALLVVNKEQCEPPLDDEEVENIARSIQRYSSNNYQLTDQGNAQRFADDHADAVRYDHTNKRWLIWDETRWAPDKDGAIFRKAIETVNKMHLSISMEKDLDKREKLAKWAHACEFRYRQESMVTMAKNIKPLAITADELDANPWLFNVLNGTIDLRTGELLPHNPKDMITKIAPEEYHSGAKSSQWSRALNDWTGGDKEYQGFLQRALGYSLTGDVSEKVFFFIYGPHDSGKTTILEAFSAVLGDYAHTAPFEMFLQKGGSYIKDGPKPEIVDLMGMRFTKSVEVLENSRFNEGFLKQITGGDSIRERSLYERGVTFKPVMKLWLAANDAPRARFDDDALWRRLLVLPFTRTIPRKDQNPKLKEILSDPGKSGAAILAWGIQGCLEWQQTGLCVPEKILQSTSSLRTEMDDLADFFEENIVAVVDETCAFSQVYKAYKNWAYTNGIKMPLTSNKFGRELKKRGYGVRNKTVKGKTEKHVFGIRLNESAKLNTTMFTNRIANDGKKK
jgi:P4 family phage/plasmid primase-like protien